MTNSVASLLPCLHPRRGAATTTDREDQVILENTRAAVSVRIDVRGCPFRGLVPLNSTSLSSTMRFWGDCVSLCTVILHAYKGMYVAACWAYSKLELVGGTIYLRERGTGWIGRMAFTWLSDDLPLLLFQVYFVIQYASNRAPLVHTQIRGTTNHRSSGEKAESSS